MKSLTNEEQIRFVIGMICFEEFTKPSNGDKNAGQVFEKVKTKILEDIEKLEFNHLTEIMNSYLSHKKL